MPMTQKEMVKLLKSHGWEEYNGGKGSHKRMRKEGCKPVTIPKGELRYGTEKSILRQAGLK
ncbi:type II toxin-antitoxin system HicA family toxin [Enterococcus sp. DIV0240a]|uniref:type II toxin-antitoxin system HicA family toxin n=1 Tax=Enterococcus sp. DIV0240a TaxID=2774651 RepID=UPI003D29CBC3